MVDPAPVPSSRLLRAHYNSAPGVCAATMAGVTFDIRGEVCVITGGGSGIGRALCNACASAGASAVVAIDFDLASAEETIAALPAPAFGQDFKRLAIYADCGKEDDIIKAVEQVEADVGPIGSFMANAGK